MRPTINGLVSSPGVKLPGADAAIDGKLTTLNEFLSVMDRREESPTPNIPLRRGKKGANCEGEGEKTDAVESGTAEREWFEGLAAGATVLLNLVVVSERSV